MKEMYVPPLTNEQAIDLIKQIAPCHPLSRIQEAIQRAVDALSVQETLEQVCWERDKALGELKRYESRAEQKNRWIPCTKCLPGVPTDDDTHFHNGEDIPANEYIVMIVNATNPTALYWTGSEWFDPGTDEVYTVVAWQPLPEPWEGEGE